MKGVIYYTHHRLREPIVSLVQEQIKKSNLPIVSCSLKPIDFGRNVVLDEKPGAITMFKQILAALEALDTKYAFFCEHDVLYHPSHFDFTPERDDVFYYNTNVWRWFVYDDLMFTYDELRSVSGICVNREFAIKYYKHRIDTIYRLKYDKIPTMGNPQWARSMGYEPGKRKKDTLPVDTDDWRSDYCNIDIRHTRNTTEPQKKPEHYHRTPVNWQEAKYSDLEYWKDICSQIHNELLNQRYGKRP